VKQRQVKPALHCSHYALNSTHNAKYVPLIQWWKKTRTHWNRVLPPRISALYSSSKIQGFFSSFGFSCVSL